MKATNYNRYPSTCIQGTIIQGWDAIVNNLQSILADAKVLVVETYTGIYEEELLNALSRLTPDLLITTRDLFKSEADILDMTKRFITNDSLFGYVTNLNMIDYFDEEKRVNAQNKILSHTGTTIIVGSGATLVAPGKATVVYADMARWEIQQRFRKQAVSALGIDNRREAVSLQYKRGYFNDWRICDKHKNKLFHKVDYWLDTHIPNQPKMIDKETFMKGINQTAKGPFRVVPFFLTRLPGEASG